MNLSRELLRDEAFANTQHDLAAEVGEVDATTGNEAFDGRGICRTTRRFISIRAYLCGRTGLDPFAPRDGIQIGRGQQVDAGVTERHGDKPKNRATAQARRKPSARAARIFGRCDCARVAAQICFRS